MCVIIYQTSTLGIHTLWKHSHGDNNEWLGLIHIYFINTLFQGSFKETVCFSVTQPEWSL